LFLKYAFLSSSIVLVILYAISFITPNIFGLQLKYYQLFAPLVKNVHQIAMILVILPFIGIKILLQEKGVLFKAFILVLIVLDIIMTLNTGSTKAMLGILLGGSTLLILSFLVGFNKINKYFILFSSIVLLALFLIQTDFFQFLEAGFKEADPSNARAEIYTKALSVGFNSPIVGHGTGPHIERSGKFWDTHQTYLAVFVQTGLIGLILFISLILKLIHKTINHPTLLAALITIIIYASGGDILRRLPIWIFLVFLFHYSEKDEPRFYQNKIKKRKKLNEKN
jgi:hypothetical protein